MTKYEGKCPSCKKVHYSDRKYDIVVCDCWLYCSICGAEMAPYTPDLTPNSYGIEGKRDFAIIMACTRHSPPFFSAKKPVEVVCT